MKLKPIPQNTVVHTPTEEEAKELLGILHENGYEWYCSGKEEGWENFGNETCYRINSHDNVYHTCDREWYETICQHCILPVLTLADFKRLYCEDGKPQPKFKVGDKVRIVCVDGNGEIISYYEYWEARYLDHNGFEADELIDALYKLLCWTLTREKNEKGKQ